MTILQSIKRQIPNCITLCNLLCGIFATYYAIQEQRLHYAAAFILLGIFCDFFDGLSARLLHVSSALGKELDSLADIVTSGVAPGFILYGILSTAEGLPWLKYAALLMPAFAAYRLAKFNLDTRQSHDFLGLPAPANALIWVGLAILLSTADRNPWLLSTPCLIGIAVLSIISNILMISELPMFSLKINFSRLSWKYNKTQYIFLSGCLLLIILLLQYSITPIILWYIVLSLITQKKASRNE